MKKSCTLCGCSYENLYAFKAGHVCENCIQQLKPEFQPDSQVQSGK